jgi:DNA-directed RNA polymerase alpha subunit
MTDPEIPLTLEEKSALDFLRGGKIEDLDCTTRTFHCLVDAGVKSIDDLCKLDRKTLMRMKNVGRKTVLEIEQILDRCGRQLEPSVCSRCGRVGGTLVRKGVKK